MWRESRKKVNETNEELAEIRMYKGRGGNEARGEKDYAMRILCNELDVKEYREARTKSGEYD